MKLLFITRKVDQSDANAGFVYNWLKKIGGKVDKLIVICQQAGDYSGLPINIEINSLGKEKSKTKLAQFFKFQALIFKNIKHVDGIFAHMMPIYSVLAGPASKLFKKKLIQWYTHKSVDFRLKLASFFVDQFVTASRESFRLKTKKPVQVLGHGIDIEQFKPLDHKPQSKDFKLITIGRISPTKDYETIIKAVYELKQDGINNLSLQIIGDVGLTSQQSYFDSLKGMVQKMNLTQQVKFLGAIPNSQTPQYLQQSDLFINLSHTGSLDKAVLEAMACQNIVLTSNEAFKNTLPNQLIVVKDNPKALAARIKDILNLSIQQRSELQQQLRQKVMADHNLDKLVGKIIKLYK